MDHPGDLTKKRKLRDRVDMQLREQEDAKHARQFLSAARTILSRLELLDITFVCGDGGEVRANGALLASGSEYFSKLLYGDMKESSMDRIPLPAVRASSLQVVISYLHGHEFRLDTDSGWDEMVEVYCLAAQYQVDLLCQRIALLVASLVSAREFGDLLNVAIPRHAEELLKAAVEAMNKVLVFDSTTSFHQWNKESIVYCLENVQFHPNVTETVVAEAVLSAASYSDRVTVEGEKTQTPSSVVGGSTAEGPENSILLKPRNRSDDEETCVTGIGGLLSRDDLREILECHVNLAFVDPAFLTNRIEPLQIMRPEVLAAVYRAQCLCLSRGLSTKSFFATPWRSLTPKVSFVPMKPGEGETCSAYAEVSLPSLWALDPECGYTISEQLPHRVEYIEGKRVNAREKDEDTSAILQLPLRNGLHIWRVCCETVGDNFATGVVTSTGSDSFDRPEEKDYWMLYADLSEGEVTEPWALSPTFATSSRIKRFSESGDSVIVILDMTKRSLTFANTLKEYLNHSGEYPAAYVDLPCDVPLYPAVFMWKPGFAEIEWIQSSPRTSNL